MRLDTKISGIPCSVAVSHSLYVPMRITGTGFGDADPPEPEEFEITDVYDRRGYKAPWLAAKMTDADSDRIFDEFKEMQNDHH